MSARRTGHRAPGTVARFLVVGALATGLQYALLAVLVARAGVAPLAASCVAFAASAAFNYLASHTVTFDSRQPHRVAAPRFAVVAALGLGINAGLFAAAHSVMNLHYMVAQVLATVGTLTWNYRAHRRWTFSS